MRAAVAHPVVVVAHQMDEASRFVALQPIRAVADHCLAGDAGAPLLREGPAAQSRREHVLGDDRDDQRTRSGANGWAAVKRTVCVSTARTSIGLPPTFRAGVERARHRRVANRLEGEHDVARRDRLAVVPEHIAAQPHGGGSRRSDRGPSVQRAPARSRRCADPDGRDQPLEDRPQHVRRGRVGDEDRVEGLRIAQDRVDESRPVRRRRGGAAPPRSHRRRQQRRATPTSPRARRPSSVRAAARSALVFRRRQSGASRMPAGVGSEKRARSTGGFTVTSRTA